MLKRRLLLALALIASFPHPVLPAPMELYIQQGSSFVPVSPANPVPMVLQGGSLPGPTTYSDVTHTYTASGAIATTDTLALVNSASPVTMTLANGSATVIQIDIHNYGSGVATITAKIEGATNSVTLQGNPAGASVTLRWLPSLTTWIIV